MPESLQRVLLNHDFMNERYKKNDPWGHDSNQKKKLNPIEPILRLKF